MNFPHSKKQITHPFRWHIMWRSQPEKSLPALLRVPVTPKALIDARKNPFASSWRRPRYRPSPYSACPVGRVPYARLNSFFSDAMCFSSLRDRFPVEQGTSYPPPAVPAAASHENPLVTAAIPGTSGHPDLTSGPDQPAQEVRTPQMAHPPRPTGHRPLNPFGQTCPVPGPKPRAWPGGSPPPLRPPPQQRAPRGQPPAQNSRASLDESRRDAPWLAWTHAGAVTATSATDVDHRAGTRYRIDYPFHPPVALVPDSLMRR